MVRKPNETQAAAESCGEAPPQKPRFKIVKLEERIAPRRGGCYYCEPKYPGWAKHGWSAPPGQVR